MTTTTPKTGKTTFHRDGTVTIWDCISEQWVRVGTLSDELSSTLSETERRKVKRHLSR